jgi:hypothetical protein
MMHNQLCGYVRQRQRLHKITIESLLNKHLGEI